MQASTVLLAFVSLCVPFAIPGAHAEDGIAFDRCTFEADRYVVCRIAPPDVESWITSQKGVHPGVAFTAYLKRYFEGRGCDYKVSEEAFRLNGVFFSLDSRAFGAISCNGAPLKLKFAPDAMSIAGATFKMSE